MSNSIIPVPAPIGTNLQSFQNTIGSNVVQAEAVTLVDSTGVEKATTGNPLKVDGSAVTQPISAASQPFPSGAGSLLSGQGTATSTAAALPNNPCKKITVKNNISSSQTIYVGPSGVTASTGLELIAGDSVDIPVSNTNLIFVITSTGSGTYSWLAVN